MYGCTWLYSLAEFIAATETATSKTADLDSIHAENQYIEGQQMQFDDDAPSHLIVELSP
jgi:hypothetical protein